MAFDALQDLPTVDQALAYAHGDPSLVIPAGQPSGNGNIVTSALGSGVYGGLASGAQGAEAIARGLGASGAADSIAGFAQRQRETAATYATPENEAASILSPRGFTYRLLQGLPLMAGIATAAGVAGASAPLDAAGVAVGAGARALLGGSAAAFPFAAGENIQRAREEGQPVDQGTALKALALGVPEAALQAALPVMGEGMLTGRIAAKSVPKIFGSEQVGARAVGALTGAVVQAPAAAAGEALMQQMGDPNRSFAERSQAILNAALAGGVQGGVIGGILHSAAKKPPNAVTTPDLERLTAGPLGLPEPQTPQLPPPGAPGMEKQLQPPQRFPPQPPTDIGGGPPGVITPEAQPGQAIRQLTDQTAPVMPGRQPVSGEVIPLGQVHQNEDTPPPPAPAQLQPPHRFPPVDGGAANERVVRPASDDEALITPPPAGGDLTQQTNAELMTSLEKQGPNTDHGKAIVGELAERLKGEKIAPGQDVREVLARQDADKAKAQIVDAQTSAIKKITRGFLPDYLKPHLGDDLALKGAIFDEAKARDAAGQPLGSRLMAIAKHFDVLNDRGALVDPRAAQEATDTARAQAEADQGATTNLGPNPDVPSRVMRDAIPEPHQPKWDALEALRKDAPQDFLPKIDELQSKLAAPKRGEAGQIVKATSDLRKAVEGQKAVDKVTGEPPTPTPISPSPIDESQGAKKFSPPVSEAKPAEDLNARLAKAKAEGGARGFNDEIQRIGAEAMSKQDQLKAKQKGGARAVQERSPAQVDVREQPQDGSGVGEGNAQGEGATTEVKAPAGAQNQGQAGEAQVAPKQVSAITKALKAVRGNISDLMDQKLPRTSRTEKGVVTPESEKNHAGRNAAYQAEMGRLDRAQAAVGKALKSGDPRELAKIGDDHFPSKAYDEFYEDLPPKGQKLMDEHVQKVDNLLEAVKEASGKNHTLTGAEAFSSRVPTPHDEVLSGLIDKGATARQLLNHIARNGSNSVRRTMAAKQLQISKANPSVRFGTLDEMQRDHPNTLRNVYGDYHDALDRIRIFDKADLEHTLLHEFEHAATVPALENNPKIKAEAEALHKLAKEQMTPEEAAHPSMANPAEMIAEAKSNPDFANLLDSLKGPRGSIWQSIKSLVRRLFGYPQGAESLLDHVEHLAGQAADVVNGTTTLKGIERTTGLYARYGLDTAAKLARKADRTFDPVGIPVRMFKKILFWRDLTGIRDSMSHLLPSISRVVQGNDSKRNYRDTLSHVVMVADNMRRALSGKPDLLHDLMLASPKGIDPTRTVDQHTWLTAEQRAAKAPEIKRLNEQWNLAKRGDAKTAQAYLALKASNDAGLYSVKVGQFRRVVSRSNVNIKLSDDPMERLQADTTGMKDDPHKQAKYWQAEFSTALSAARTVKSTIEHEVDPTKRAEMYKQASDLLSWERDATRTVKAMSQEPNFAVRRYGDQHVSFDLDPKTFGAAQANEINRRLDAAGFGDIVVDHNIDNHTAYARVQGVGQMQKLRDVLQKAVDDKLISKIKSSGSMEALVQKAGVVPDYLTSEIKAFREAFPRMEIDESDPDVDRARAYNSALDRQLNELHSSLMDILPDSNPSKLFAHRENIQGMGRDMGKAFVDRGMNVARMAAHLFASDELDAAHKGLRAEVEAAKRDPNVSVAVQNRMQMAANEVLLRGAAQQLRTAPNAFDAARRWTHFFELSLSVPYTLMLHTQAWTLGHAELAKHFSYARSGMEMMKANVASLDVLRRVFGAEGVKDFVTGLGKPGSDRWGAVMTADKLASMKDTGLRDYLIKLDNMGVFNNSRTQMVFEGLHHVDGIARQIHDISSAWTLYSEMQPRYATAIAAYKLYKMREAEGKAPKGKDWNDIHSFGANAVNRSQMEWGAENSPRAFGKQGFAGSASPIAAQFQLFHAKILEKMYREFADAMGKRDTKNADGTVDKTYSTQARRFLLTHLAATTMLTGTMGLPAVSMLAGLYDRLADLVTGDDTHDIRASYRQWLSQTYGNDMGEVLAHGVPRLGGMDLSGLGEDRIIPFTDLATNKQKLEDAWPEYLKNAVGSAPHLGYNLLLGLRDLLNGDTLEGLSKVSPEALRNIAEGALIDKYGYADKAGFQKPGIKPSSMDVVMKMLGFHPSDEANYTEKARIAAGIRDRQEYDTQNIQTHLAKAFNRQDPAAYADWMRSNNLWAAGHPGQMPPAGTFGQYLTEHMRSAGMAGALGTPLGVSPRDFLTRGMVKFGNLGDQ